MDKWGEKYLSEQEDIAFRKIGEGFAKLREIKRIRALQENKEEKLKNDTK